MRLLWRSFVDFFRDDGPMLAGSITCFSLMALVPFLLLLVSLLGYLIGEHLEFYSFLAARLVGFFPEATAEITEALGDLVAYKKIGLLTLAVYAYFSYQLYYSLERAVNILFGSPGKRSLFASLLISLFGVTSGIILIIISFGATSIVSLLESRAGFLPGLIIGEVTALLVGFVLPVLLVFVSTSALYVVLPQKRIKYRHALAGALFTAMLIEAAKHVFTYYAAIKVTQMGNVYGPLTAFIMFLLWVFYAACIFLMGAEIVRNQDAASQERQKK